MKRVRKNKAKKQFFVKSIKSTEKVKWKLGDKFVLEGTVYTIKEFPCTVFAVNESGRGLGNVQVNLHNITKYKK